MNTVDITRIMQCLPSTKLSFVQTFSAPGVSTCKTKPGILGGVAGPSPRSAVARTEPTTTSRWADTETASGDEAERTGRQGKSFPHIPPTLPGGVQDSSKNSRERHLRTAASNAVLRSA